MAKSNTADTTSLTTAAPAAVAAPSAKSAPVVSQEYTEAQRSPESFLKDATALFGNDPPRVTKEAPKKEEKKETAEVKEDKPVKAKADKEETIKEPESKEEEFPTLPDDEEDTETSEGDDKTEKGKLAKSEFEKRELKREHKETVRALHAKIETLEANVKQVVTGASAPEADGYFKGVQTSKDVDERAKALEKWEAFYEDNEDGYEAPDGTVYEKKDVKQSLRAVRAELKKAASLTKAFEDIATRKEAATAKAKKLTPWVSDPDHRHNKIVLDLAKEHPELAKAPDASYLLGLLTIGKLWETGKVKIVSAIAAPAKAKEDDKAPVKVAPVVARQPVQRDEPEDNPGFSSTSSAALQRAMSVFG